MSRILLQQAYLALRSAARNDGNYLDYSDVADAIESELAKPEQEPVAWVEHEWSGTGVTHLHFDRRKPTLRDEVLNPVWTPLYTAPPRKEWVDLTADGFKELLKMTVQGIDKNKLTEPEGIWLFGSLVQAKLKELNK